MTKHEDYNPEMHPSRWTERCIVCNTWEYGGHRDGICNDCYDKSTPLIKSDDHYVVRSYRCYRDGSGQSNEDVNASLPNIEWDKHREKFKVTFHAPDVGGYDVFLCEWWFDSLDAIIEHIMRKGSSDD